MPRPSKLIDGLVRELRRVDPLWVGAATTAPPGAIACRAGCFGCCVGLFEISGAEALVVRAAVARLPEDEREDVVRRAADVVRRTAASFPGDSASGLLDAARSEAADDAYFDLVSEIPCPLLELPSGRCRIYRDRPITCRTYGLAWVRGAELVHPPCGLNFLAATEAEVLESSIELDRQNDAEAALSRGASETRLGPDAETTLVHAVVGTAFDLDGAS